MKNKSMNSHECIRPRRYQPSTVKYTSQTIGISWKEEQQLSRALHASLGATKKPQIKGKGLFNRREPKSKNVINNVHSAREQLNRKRKVSKDPGLRRILAQRKFAHGSRPNSPNLSIYKKVVGGVNFYTTRNAKTEDFLTFLCFRHTNLLSPDIDFSKISDNENDELPIPCEPLLPAQPQSIFRRGSHTSSSKSNTPDRDMEDLIREIEAEELQRAKAKIRIRSSKQLVRSASALLAKKTKSPSTKKNAQSQTNKSRRHVARNAACKSAKLKLSKSNLPTRTFKEVKANFKMSTSSAHSPRQSPKKKLNNQRRTRSSSIIDRDIGELTRDNLNILAELPRLSRGLKTKMKKRKHRSINHVNGYAKAESDHSPAKKSKATDCSKGQSKMVQKRQQNRNIIKRLEPDSILKSVHSNRKHLRSCSVEPTVKKSKISLDTSKMSPRRLSLRGVEKSELQSNQSLSGERGNRASSHAKSQSHCKQLDAQVILQDKTGGHNKSEPFRKADLVDPRSKTDSHGKTDAIHSGKVCSRSKIDTPSKIDQNGMPNDRPPPEVVERQLRKAPVAAVLRTRARAQFPTENDTSRIVMAPVYHPSPEQFEDPISYIQSIRGDAEPFGMCRIVPPNGWKPECQFEQDLRFQTQTQYVHQMHKRWGSNSLMLEAIRRHVDSMGLKLEKVPTIGGIEIDLPGLFHAMSYCGGLQTVINKNRWNQVASMLNIPQSAPDKTTRLYDTYCKYLLTFATLSSDERGKAVSRAGKNGKGNDLPECVVKSRSRQLSEFFRLAKTAEGVWLSGEMDTVEKIESEFWNRVLLGQDHVAVVCAHVDCRTVGSGFPKQRDSPYSKHGWNFQVLQTNSGSVLRALGPLSVVSSPLLHVNMINSALCWNQDLHQLPYIVYSHTGAENIWYCIPKGKAEKFKSICNKLVPELLYEGNYWLEEDTIMVSPDQLVSHGLSVCRAVQSQGEFLIVFSGSFTSSVSCGYNLLESLHFATPDWLASGITVERSLRAAHHMSLFSMTRLLVRLLQSDKYYIPSLVSLLTPIVQVEISSRKRLRELGVKMKRMAAQFSADETCHRKNGMQSEVQEVSFSCDECRYVMFLSSIHRDNEILCLSCALNEPSSVRNLKRSTLLFRMDEREIRALLEKKAQCPNNVAIKCRTVKKAV